MILRDFAGPLAAQFQAINLCRHCMSSPGSGHESNRESRPPKSAAGQRSLDGQGGSSRRALPKLLKSVEAVGLTLACGGVRWCKMV